MATKKKTQATRKPAPKKPTPVRKPVADKPRFTQRVPENYEGFAYQDGEGNTYYVMQVPEAPEYWGVYRTDEQGHTENVFDAGDDRQTAFKKLMRLVVDKQLIRI